MMSNNLDGKNKQPFVTVSSIYRCEKINWKCWDSRAPFQRSLLLDSYVVLTKIISTVILLVRKLFFRSGDSFLNTLIPLLRPVPRQ